MTTEEKYKAIKKKLGLTDTEIAKMFGYTSIQSYTSSSGKIKIVRGIVALYERIGERFSDTFDID